LSSVDDETCFQFVRMKQQGRTAQHDELSDDPSARIIGVAAPREQAKTAAPSFVGVGHISAAGYDLSF
jgi:hypothetical protein